MGKPKSDYTIQTVSNALRLLEVFYQDAELGVSELARRLGLHKNNVFRLLATLELAGYVQQSPKTERYRLGTRCIELGRAYARSHTLCDRARPVLEMLVERLGETAHLAVLRDFEVVHLEGLVPPQLLVTASRAGQRLPAHCTALGKVLIGCADEGTIERFDRSCVEGRSLPARTESSIVDAHKLFEHLRAVGGQGFALDLGECEPGLHCAAAPVFGADGLAAALSVSGPSLRLSEDTIFREVLPILTEAADALSQAMGHQPEMS